MVQRRGVLQLHSEYSSKTVSGENQSVASFSSELSNLGHSRRIIISTDEISNSIWKLILQGFKYVFSSKFSKEELEKFDVLMIHNTIPFFGPRLIKKIGKNKIIVFAWHNNRRFCIKGTNFRKGKFCDLCQGRTGKLSGIFLRCYRNSIVQSIIVTLAEFRFRSIMTSKNTFHIVFSRYYSKILEKNHILSKNVFLLRHAIPIDSSSKFVDMESRTDFLAVGRFDSEKGFEELVEAWYLIDPNVRGESKLHIVGDGQRFQAIQASIFCESIVLYGKKSFSEIRELSATCRAGIVPSQCPESFGRVVVEFYSLNLPVIVTPSGALIEIAEMLDSNLVSKDISPGAIAHTIEKFIVSGNDYGDQPFNIVQKHFDIEKHQSNLNQILDKLQIGANVESN